MSATRHEHEPVRKWQDPLEAMLRHHDGQSEVVDEARQRAQHLLGRSRIERRCRFVEDEDAGRCSEHGSDGDPLLLATGEGAERPIAQLLNPQEIERVLDPPAHGVRRHPQVLHGVGQLVLDPLGDEAGQRVLTDKTDDVGEVPRSVVPGRPPLDGDRAA
jgi:hypothetical protein